MADLFDFTDATMPDAVFDPANALSPSSSASHQSTQGSASQSATDRLVLFSASIPVDALRINILLPRMHAAMRDCSP
jgi:hypothetical protein